MSRICQSCSLPNHCARPHLVSLIIDWAHLQSLTSTLHKLTHLCHSSDGFKVTTLHGCSALHWSLSACLPVCPGSGPRLRKRKFTYSATVHPASKAFFVISPMLEALPELYWINHLVLASASLSPWHDFFMTLYGNVTFSRTICLIFFPWTLSLYYVILFQCLFLCLSLVHCSLIFFNNSFDFLQLLKILIVSSLA